MARVALFIGVLLMMRAIQAANLVCGSQIDSYKDVPALYNGPAFEDSCGNGGKKGPDGYQWQCVEYIRRFYRLRKSIDTTRWDNHGDAKDYVKHPERFGLIAFVNGLSSGSAGAASSPQIDDIIGFGENTDNKYGHVAIIREVMDTGGSQFAVRIIEQNFSKNISKPLTVQRNQDGTFFMPSRGKYRIQGWLRLPSTTGSIAVSATLDTNTQFSGGLNYTITDPSGQSLSTTSTVPLMVPNLQPGSYTITYNSGGPANATLAGISPCPITSPPSSVCKQTLAAGQSLTFTFTFQSKSHQPPTAGFLMSSGNQSASNGQTLSLSVSQGGTATVLFDGSSPRSGPDGTIASWSWSINGAFATTSPTFTRALSAGTYNLSLVVTDNFNAQSQPVTATVVIIQLVLNPTVLFDASQDPPHFFFSSLRTPLLVSSVGDLIVESEHYGSSCGFSICGVRMNSISPSGTLHWQTPGDGSSYFSPRNEGSIVLGPNDRVYAPGFAATLYAFESNGSAAQGFPISIGGGQAFNSATPLAIDFRDGTVYAESVTTFSFSGFPGRIRAMNPDGTQKWHDDFSNLPSGVPGFAIGPARDVYSVVGSSQVLVALDHGNGVQACQSVSGLTFGFGSLIGSLLGIFSSDGSHLSVFDANCNATVIYTSSGQVQPIAIDQSQGVIFALETISNKRSLIAVSTTGTPLWSNSSIFGGGDAVQAVANGVVYALGLDSADGNKPKLFLVNEQTGRTSASIETTNLCSTCSVSVSSAGKIYLLGSPKIYRLN